MDAATMWSAYTALVPEMRNAAYEAWRYGSDDPDALAKLTLCGTKTATASALPSYAHEHCPPPEPGCYSVVLDTADEAVCILRTERVSTVPFDKVGARQAYKEGEGDRSLAYWRQVHRTVFTAELAEYGLAFTETMPVVCEEFTLVYPVPRAPQAGVSLRRIDESNYLDCFRLTLAPGQERYVSHPVRSLAQAYVYYHQCTPFGVYDGDTMVGYLMVIFDPDETTYNLWHLMIDAAWQGRGYGGAAIDCAIAYMRTQPFGRSDVALITVDPENAAAYGMYLARGFAPTGRSDDGEVELALSLS